MNTKHLITFVTFAKKKSFLKTSMELHYAESTLAEHITSLERELGVKLIEAGSRGSRLTKAGEAFLPRAEEILGMWRDVQQQMMGILPLVTIGGNCPKIRMSASAYARMNWYFLYHPATGLHAGHW